MRACVRWRPSWNTHYCTGFPPVKRPDVSPPPACSRPLKKNKKTRRQVHTLAASWCLLTPVLAPVVAFEIALAVYVEGERKTLTAAEVFTPLIVWCW